MDEALTAVGAYILGFLCRRDESFLHRILFLVILLLYKQVKEAIM